MRLLLRSGQVCGLGTLNAAAGLYANTRLANTLIGLPASLEPACLFESVIEAPPIHFDSTCLPIGGMPYLADCGNCCPRLTDSINVKAGMTMCMIQYVTEIGRPDTANQKIS
mmetsp:Transcript_140535/g.255441  ORF Transcript_140535/g.255441 Transcript_140535/m.255441 type:complete len:112 (-) Transcript_140535:7-342(-)